MTVISKQQFYEKITADLKCDKLHYLDPNCFKGNVFLAPNMFLGCLKFFLPVYIIKGIINYKKLKDKNFVLSLILQEIRGGCYGIAFAGLFFASNCILCKLFGRLHYYNIGLISGMVCGLAVLVETKENRTLDTLIFFNSVVEAVFTNLDNLNIFKLNKTREVVMFMAISGLLMHLLQNREKNLKYINFWFYMPEKFQKNDQDSKNMLEQKCSHKDACDIYAFKGGQRFFILGLIFSAVRKLIPQMMSLFKKPEKIVKICFNKDNIKFGMFIGTYVGVYRYIMCTLLKTKHFNQKYFGAVAGLLSGSAYAISPNLQVLVVGITTVLQIFYNTTLQKLKVKNQLIPQQMVFMLSNGLLFHNAIMSNKTCPPYYLNMLSVCTNNVFGEVYKNIILAYF